MGHKLIGGTLEGTETGIVAKCQCGWTSGYYFSSLAASAAFADHQEKSAQLDNIIETACWD